jgi:cell division protein FtsB
MITVFAAIFFVILLTALITNLVKMASLNSRKAQLLAELERAEQVIQESEDEINYRKTDEYVDAYAREYLGMIGKDEIAFVAK